MTKFSAVLLAAIGASFVLPAAAQFAKPEDAIKYRKNALFVMQQNFGRVAAMAGGKAPFDAKVAAESAAVAEFTSKLPWETPRPNLRSGLKKPNLMTRPAKCRLKWQNCPLPPRVATSTASRSPSMRLAAPANPATTTSAPSKTVFYTGGPPALTAPGVKMAAFHFT